MAGPTVDIPIFALGFSPLDCGLILVHRSEISLNPGKTNPRRKHGGGSILPGYRGLRPGLRGVSSDRVGRMHAACRGMLRMHASAARLQLVERAEIGLAGGDQR